MKTKITDDQLPQYVDEIRGTTGVMQCDEYDDVCILLRYIDLLEKEKVKV